MPLAMEEQDTGKDRDINSHLEDTRGIDTGHNNDNESTNSLDTTLAFGGSEADGHLGGLLPSSLASLTVLTREINSLQQQVEAIEVQPVEGLDHIEWELRNLSLTQGATGFNPSTYKAFWRSDTPIHRYTMYHTEANKSHKFTATGHCCLQWTWLNKIRGMVNRLGNSSWSH